MKTLGILGASVAAALGAVTAVSCSNDSGPAACGGCGCGDANATQTIDVPFTACGDAGDADADGGDSGACFATCAEACNATYSGSTCLGTSDEGGQTVAECQVVDLCTGRKLEGLGAPVAGRLATMAWLEAASVGAFRRLARELRAHGAPSALVRRAQRCARDEARHARIMARLARSRGERVPRVRNADAPVRDLEAVARENAVVGCVRETFGAAQAALGRAHADAGWARAMRSIAPDELRHAALAWDVAAWAEARLDRAARSRVRASRDAATREVLQDTRISPRDHAMAESLQATLWGHGT